MGEEVVGSLVIGAGGLDEIGARRGERAEGAGAQVDLILGDLTHGLEHRQDAVRRQLAAEVVDRPVTGKVELRPRQLVRPESGEEGLFAVLAELGVDDVGPFRLERAHVPQAGDKLLGDARRDTGGPGVVAAHAPGAAQKQRQDGGERRG